ncbi:MAG: AAA family ATPase [Planctomycetes bacterium]|nr:AAA family ATPase [Planctomycetota bacterium]
MSSGPYRLKPFLQDVVGEDGKSASVMMYRARDARGEERIESPVRHYPGKPRGRRWLWPGRIARGQVTLIVGDQGVGKSFLLHDLMARAVGKLPWPEFDPSNTDTGAIETSITATGMAETGIAEAAAGSCEHILYISRQDEEETVDSRLAEFGLTADHVTRFEQVRSAESSQPGAAEQRLLQLPFDMSMIANEMCANLAIDLVVIDPLSDFCDSPRRLHQALRELNDLARETGAAIVVTLPAHCRFDAQGTLRVTSAYRTDEARSVWCVVPDPECSARRLFVARRTNGFVEPTGLAFFLRAGRLSWNLDEQISAGDPLARETTINEVLKVALEKGPMPASAVFRTGAQYGFAPAQLRAAARRLGIEFRKGPGFGENGGWVWDWLNRAACGTARSRVAAEYGAEDGAEYGAEDGADEGEEPCPVAPTDPVAFVWEPVFPMAEGVEEPFVPTVAGTRCDSTTTASPLASRRTGAASAVARGPASPSAATVDESAPRPAEQPVCAASKNLEISKSLEKPAENAIFLNRPHFDWEAAEGPWTLTQARRAICSGWDAVPAEFAEEFPSALPVAGDDRPPAEASPALAPPAAVVEEREFNPAADLPARKPRPRDRAARRREHQRNKLARKQARLHARQSR